MITEHYVGFDTAKMLKEAGFDEVCTTFYSSSEGAPTLLHSRNSELKKKHYSRPSQALSARWLREVHGIVVDVTFIPPKSDKNWQYFIGEINNMVWKVGYKV